MSAHKKLAKFCWKKLNRHCLRDPGDYRKSVFMAGVGRSGTTWLEDIINYDNDFRLMFEPFHPEKVEMLKGWEMHHYLRPENDDPVYLEPAGRILSGDIRNDWSERFNRNLCAERRLIKDIRTNLMMGWINAHFPDMPVIFVMRHPCAVALSHQTVKWKADMGTYLRQDDLVEDYLRPFVDEIEGASDPFELSVFSWCISNHVALKQLGGDGVYVCLYEHFVAETEKNVRDLFGFLGMEFDTKVLKKSRKPSSVSHRTSAVKQKRDPLTSWQERVSPADAQRAIEILKLFGLDRIYSGEPMPLVGGSEVLDMLG